MTAVRSWIGEPFISLVKGLSRVERALRGEAERAIRLALQFCKIVEESRGNLGALPLELLYRSLSVLDACEDGFRELPIVWKAREWAIGMRKLARRLESRGETTPFGLEIHADLEVVLRREIADGALSLDDERERRGLDAAHAKPLFVAEAIVAREVHPDEPIRTTAPIRGVVEAIILLERPQRGEPAGDRLVGKRADEEAREAHFANANLGDEIAKDELSFAARIGRTDNLLVDRIAKKALYDGVLLFGALADDERKLGRDHRQRRKIPTSPRRLYATRLCDLNEVTDRPAHVVALTGDITFPPSTRAEDARDIPRNRRLLCDHEDLFFAATSHRSGPFFTIEAARSKLRLDQGEQRLLS